MNSFYKSLFFVICACTVSCTESSLGFTPSNQDETIVQPSESVIGKKADSQTSLIKHHKVSASDVLSILESRLDRMKQCGDVEYSLRTILKNGDPMLHIVNFENGGWAIVAGNKRESNQILAMSEAGYFNPDSITNPNVAFWFSMQLAQMETIEFEENDAEQVEEGSVSLNSIPPFDEEYVWVRLPMETQVTTSFFSEVGHLLTTKWGQGYPWNYKCPIINGQRSPTGCVAVAVAQLLYYYHFFLGVPSGLYHSVIPQFSQHEDYLISSVERFDYQSNSNRWTEMATNFSLQGDSTDYVGDLMIDIGEKVGMKYRESSSGVAFDDYKNVFSLYGLSTRAIDYNSSLLISSLDAYKPVLISAKREASTSSQSNLELEGHSWVVDGYECYRTVTDRPFKWVIMPPDSLSYFTGIDYDYVLTEEEKDWNYPDIEENQIEHTYSYVYEYYLKMNWGYGGSYDNNNYDLGTYSWITDANPFTYYPKMIYDFKPDNL